MLMGRLSKMLASFKGSMTKVLVLFFIFQPLATVWAAPVQSNKTADATSSPVVLAEPKVEIVHPLVSSTEKKGASLTAAVAYRPGDYNNGLESKLINSVSLKKGLPDADQSTGALVYSYQISIPPGRNGLEPDVTLSYNSQVGENTNLFGLGWSLSVPSIERLNKKGADQLFSQNYFDSSFDGELIDLGNGVYGPKSESGDFRSYSFVDNQWVVKDKKGMVYKFGITSQARIDNPSNSSKVFKWMLEEVRDTNDNFISYSYTKNGGYVYPDKVVYTGNGSTAGAFEVSFVTETRNDAATSAKFGFLTSVNLRIKEIDVKASGSLVRKYAINYAVGSGQRSLLASITETGFDELGTQTVLPPTQFSYRTSTSGFTQDTTWHMPTYMGNLWLGTEHYGQVQTIGQQGRDIGTRLVDINGDGLTDIVFTFIKTVATYDINNVPTTAYVPSDAFYINNGHGFTQDTTWHMPMFNYDTFNGVDSYRQLMITDSFEDTGTRFVDINGDGLPDIINAGWKTVRTYANGNSTSMTVPAEAFYINNGHGFTQDTTWHMPTYMGNLWLGTEHYAQVQTIGQQGRDIGTRLVDINGDGLTDIIFTFIKTIGVYNENNVLTTTSVPSDAFYINNGHGFTQDTAWHMPMFNNDTFNGVDSYSQLMITNYFQDTGTRFVDINSDGLPDIINAGVKTVRTYANGYLSSSMVPADAFYINNGHGFTQDTTWHMPMYAAGQDGWVYDDPTNAHDVMAQMQTVDSSGHDLGTRFVDFNGDGLTDIINAGPKSITKRDAYGRVWNSYYVSADAFFVNTGHGFVQDTTWHMPMFNYDTFNGVDSFNQLMTTDASFGDPGTRFVDFNGDGLPDIINAGWKMVRTYANGNSTSVTMPTEAFYINNGPQPNLLSHITYPTGGYSDELYQNTPQYTSGGTLSNPSLPLNLQTIKQITNSDGTGANITKAYSYEGGKYYFAGPFDRRFSGFAKIVETDASGNTTKQYFHQGDTSDSSHGEYQDDGWKIGRVYRTEIADASDNLYSKTINKWDDYDMGSGRKFVKLAQTVDSVYDGDSTHKDKAESYIYDNATGNTTEKVEYGDVTGSDDGTFADNGTDKFTTDYSYASNAGAHILGLKSQETTIDQSSNKVKESRFYYDTQALGSVLKGNQTKEEDWKTGSTYVNTQKTYDSTYGLVATSTDQRGKVTTYSPDTLNLYPASVTDPLSHVASYVYDYSLGKPKQTTDPNNRVFQTVFDGLDRVTAEKQPDIASPTTLVTKTAYVYTDTSGAVSVKKSDYLDDATIADSYTYFDGLGRKIQTRQETEGSNFSVSDFVYDTRGLLNKESLSYFSTGSAKTSATATTALYTTYAYDPMGRVTTATDANGTTTNTYNDRKLTVTDANGKTKDLIKDAYGNLVEVDEHNGASTYVTTYAFDRLGDLTKVTDALGNVRNFTYDGLGRRLTAEDLHAAGDSSFGAWSYVYDDAGNLTSKTDPNSQTTNYAYDDINRPITEDYTGHAGTEVTNSYDSGTDGIGRLTSTANGAVSKTLVYNALGLVASETSTIDTVGYTTTYGFNRQGGQTLVTNPDSSQVKYIFNSAGLLDQVQRKESTDASFTNVVSNFDYSPMGQVTVTANANGTTTTNTYDASHRYRLATKVTTGNGGTHLQDIAYTYDPVGNVTQLVDASATSTAKTVVYTYDDLYRLLTATATNVASDQTPYTQTYTYDAIGNILTGPAGTYAYAGNQGSSYANPNAATTVGSDALAYDNNGNLLTKGSSLANTWDYNNRLTQAVAGAVTSTYAYDPSGSRIKSSDGTTATYYPTGAYNIAGTTPTKHITANGVTVATVTGTGATAAINYISTDHLTGANIATNSAGTQQEALDYLPYGTIRIDQKAGSFSEQRKYAGHEFDATTGLSYMGARYYDASIGRFLSEDPAFLAVGDANLLKSITKQDQSTYLTGPQVFNSFAYARNNPLIYVDPNGSYPQWMNPIAFLPERMQVSLGNWANNTAANNGVFDYATSNDWVGYSLGGVTLATGGTAAVLAGLGAAATVASGSTAIASQADNVRRSVNGALNIGQSFGKYGTVIENCSEKITGFTVNHGIDQVITRGVGPEALKNTVGNPLAVLQQSGSTRLFLSEQAGVVLNKLNQVVTAYNNNNFNEGIKDIISKALNK